jgi:putative lipoprotein (rSAM/lipoprotein system)
MKLKFLSRSNKILFFFIGLLGFSSACDKKHMDRYYGTPYAEFSLTINGLTKSKNSKEAISNIKVSLRRVKTDQQGVIQDTIALDSTYTDKNGQFFMTSDEYSSSYIINLKDIDVTENGSFKDKDTTIILSSGDFEDVDGELDQERASKYLYLYLDPKP